MMTCLSTVLSGKIRKLSNFVESLETRDMKAVHADSDSDVDLPLSHIAKDKERKL